MNDYSLLGFLSSSSNAHKLKINKNILLKLYIFNQTFWGFPNYLES